VEFVPDHDPNERLYRLVGAVLEAIENGSDLSKSLRYFESWLLRLVGFFPDLSQCSGCGEAIGGDDVTFVTADGSPRCRKCSEGNGAVVDPALRVAVREMCGLHPTALDRVALDEGQIARLAEINYQIIRHALERELKSHGLLIG
jgi:DNA repair protein RecO